MWECAAQRRGRCSTDVVVPPGVPSDSSLEARAGGAEKGRALLCCLQRCSPAEKPPPSSLGKDGRTWPLLTDEEGQTVLPGQTRSLQTEKRIPGSHLQHRFHPPKMQREVISAAPAM